MSIGEVAYRLGIPTARVTSPTQEIPGSGHGSKQNMLLSGDPWLARIDISLRPENCPLFHRGNLRTIGRPCPPDLTQVAPTCDDVVVASASLPLRDRCPSQQLPDSLGQVRSTTRGETHLRPCGAMPLRRYVVWLRWRVGSACTRNGCQYARDDQAHTTVAYLDSLHDAAPNICHDLKAVGWS